MAYCNYTYDSVDPKTATEQDDDYSDNERPQSGACIGIRDGSGFVQNAVRRVVGKDWTRAQSMTRTTAGAPDACARAARLTTSRLENPNDCRIAIC